MKKTILLYVLAVFMTNCNISVAGNVKVKLTYPSDAGMPSLNVYLKNTLTNKIYSYTTKGDEYNYEFKNIPAGKYIAYCYLNEPNATLSAGYTKFVPCGLSVNCKDHSFIEFDVTEKGTMDNIDIGDWYGAEVPAQK